MFIVVCVVLSSALCFPVWTGEAGSSAVDDGVKEWQQFDTVQTIDASKVIVVQPKVARYNFDAIPKDPLASLFFSVSLPGSGQFYNREYGRGIAVAATFYPSAWLFKHLMDRWTALNTDTFYVEEVDRDGLRTGRIRQATAFRPEAELVGLSRPEKALFLLSGSLATAAYVFGIVDAVFGAKRYNRKITIGYLDNVEVELSALASMQQVNMRLCCDF